MSDWSFLMMARSYRVISLFQNPFRVLDRVGLRPGITVVDYACGPARLTSEIARRVGAEGTVWAVDIVPRAMTMVRRAAERAGLANIRTSLADGYSSGLPDACADLILLIDAFHAISDRPALLRELRRIARPGAALFLKVDHMAPADAMAAVAASGLFRLVEQSGRELRFVAA
jgi:ubiquinone/menaquinone biosynthesis C-methylase UbiE